MRSAGVVVTLLVAVGLAGCVGSEPTCPGDWHAAVYVYLHGEKVSFTHPAYYVESGMSAMTEHVRMEKRYPDVWHFTHEPRQCTAFAVPAGMVDMILAPGRLVLSGTHAELGIGGDFRDGSNGTLHVLTSPGDADDWRPLTVEALLTRQLQDGERVLIAFGTETQAGLEALAARCPPPEPWSASRNGTDPSSS